MFPTHVGIALGHGAGPAQGLNVPYACGDCATQHASGTWRISCSLRMWGLRGGPPDGRDRAGMFPTHVGIARLINAKLSWCCNVPYACGNCTTFGPYRYGIGICSLRMWGLRGFPARYALGDGMFPTHVGIARQSCRKPCAHRNVPYAHGNYVIAQCPPTWHGSCAGEPSFAECRTGHALGRVGLGLQPDPSCRQVQKTQESLRVFVVAGGRTVPWFEPADAPFHGIVCLVPFRVIGIQVPAPAGPE